MIVAAPRHPHLGLLANCCAVFMTVMDCLIVNVALETMQKALGADLARLRLGIGPFQRPLVDFVLGEWTDPEWERIDAMDAPFARFMDLLQGTADLGALSGAVNPESFWTPPLP